MLRPELSESSNVSEDEGEHLCKFWRESARMSSFLRLGMVPFHSKILRSLSIILNLCVCSPVVRIHRLTMFFSLSGHVQAPKGMGKMR